jgi:hypothetical protein
MAVYSESELREKFSKLRDASNIHEQYAGAREIISIIERLANGDDQALKSDVTGIRDLIEEIATYPLTIANTETKHDQQLADKLRTAWDTLSKFAKDPLFGLQTAEQPKTVPNSIEALMKEASALLTKAPDASALPPAALTSLNTFKQFIETFKFNGKRFYDISDNIATYSDTLSSSQWSKITHKSELQKLSNLTTDITLINEHKNALMNIDTLVMDHKAVPTEDIKKHLEGLLQSTENALTKLREISKKSTSDKFVGLNQTIPSVPGTVRQKVVKMKSMRAVRKPESWKEKVS